VRISLPPHGWLILEPAAAAQLHALLTDDLTERFGYTIARIVPPDTAGTDPIIEWDPAPKPEDAP
jgi:hypothetical protein